MNPFASYENVVMLLAPVDIASTATTTPYVDLRNAIRAAFLVSLGVLTTASASDTSVITVACATAEGGAEATVAFRYRKSGITTANTWDAIATADTTGLSIGSTDDGKMVWIEIDPAELAASEYRFARVVLTDTDDMTALLVSVHAFLEARYKQTTHISATASASA